MILSEIESPKGPMRLQACDQLHSNSYLFSSVTDDGKYRPTVTFVDVGN